MIAARDLCCKVIGSGHADDKVPSKSRGGVVLVYALFASVGILAHHWLAEGEFSSVLTLSALFELLAVCLLGKHVLTSKSAQGISVKSLQLEAIALASRLASTTWLHGYLPNDATGDWLYQFFDVLSLVLILGLVYKLLKGRVYSVTYDADGDQMAIGPFVVVCFVLACILHADLDERPMFDTLWYNGVFLASVAQVPYLWLLARSKSPAPAMACHFVAVMAVSRVLSGAYMWEAHEEFTCEPFYKDFNHAGWSVIVAHGIHLILLGDFAYFYVKSLTKAGLQSSMDVCSTFVV